MPQLLPLFPLELVVFPGEQVKLHIFEPRYKQLIGECRAGNSLFGIPPYVDGGVAKYGTSMRVLEVLQEYPGGEMDIVTQGESAFRLLTFLREAPDKLYPAGDVEFLPNEPDAPQELRSKVIEQYRRLQDMLGVPRHHASAPGPDLSFNLAAGTGLDLLKRLQLLAMPREDERLRYLLHHLEQVIPALQAAEEVRRHTQGNGRPKKLPPLNF